MIDSWLRAIGFYRAFFVVSFIPASMGLLVALHDGHAFSLLKFFLALSGIWAFHIGTNLINDYYDFLFRTDVVNKVLTPFSGGTRVIIDGSLKAESIRSVAIASFITGFIPLSILAYLAGPPIMMLAVTGWFSGYYYSAPPFKFAYHGLGELFIGLNFGPFILITSYLSQAPYLSSDAVFASLILGLFSAAVIAVNEFPDYEADKETGKKNLVVRLGLRGGLTLYSVILFSAFGLILSGVISELLHVSAVISLLLLPKVIGIIRRLAIAPQDVSVMTASSAGTIQTFVLTWIILSSGFVYEILKGPN